MSRSQPTWKHRKNWSAPYAHPCKPIVVERSPFEVKARSIQAHREAYNAGEMKGRNKMSTKMRRLRRILRGTQKAATYPTYPF